MEAVLLCMYTQWVWCPFRKGWTFPCSCRFEADSCHCRCSWKEPAWILVVVSFSLSVKFHILSKDKRKDFFCIFLGQTQNLLEYLDYNPHDLENSRWPTFVQWLGARGYSDINRLQFGVLHTFHAWVIPGTYTNHNSSGASQAICLKAQ